jgi:ribonuclease VapC
VTFLDTSALIAILASEPDADNFAAKLETADETICAGHVILEASMRLSTLLGFAPTVADQLITRLLREAGIAVVPITEEIAHLAVTAFEHYGKGRNNDANLNFGDCLSYACAKAHGAALLFKGDDFVRTDISCA